MTESEKIETVKTEMSEYQRKQNRIALLRQRLADIEDDINNPSIVAGGRAHGSGVSAGAARLVLIKSEVEEQLQIAENEYNTERSDILRRIDQLPETDKTIIEQRYIYSTPARALTYRLHISKSTYYDWHDKACLRYYDTK